MKGFLAGFGLFFAFILGMAAYTQRAEATCSNCGTLTYQNGIGKVVLMDANNNTIGAQISIVTNTPTITNTPNGGATVTPTLTATPGNFVQQTPTGSVTPGVSRMGCVTYVVTCTALALTPCPSYQIPRNAVPGLNYVMVSVGPNAPTPYPTFAYSVQTSLDGIEWNGGTGAVVASGGVAVTGEAIRGYHNMTNPGGNVAAPGGIMFRVVPTMMSTPAAGNPGISMQILYCE